MERIPVSERTRENLKAVIDGTSEGNGTSELIRLAARLIIEERRRARRATRWGASITPAVRPPAATATGEQQVSRNIGKATSSGLPHTDRCRQGVQRWPRFMAYDYCSQRIASEIEPDRALG